MTCYLSDWTLGIFAQEDSIRCTHTRTRTRKHEQTHARTHERKHARTHKPTHTNTHMQGSTELACFNVLHRTLKLYENYCLSEPLCIILLVITAGISLCESTPYIVALS